MNNTIEVPLAFGARPYHAQGPFLVPDSIEEHTNLENIYVEGALASGVWSTDHWALQLDSPESAQEAAEEINDSTLA